MVGMLANKVVKLENTKVYDQIQKYLEKLGYKSLETQRVYKSEIKSFFKLRNNKQLEHLTIEDVQLTLDDFEDYISYLYNITDEEGNKKYSNKTTNKKISAVKGCISYLSSKKIDGEYIVKDISYFPQIEHLPEIKNQYGVLEAHEVFKMAQLAYETEREKGSIKRLLFLFALDTAIRKQAILDLQWSNFIEQEDGVLVTVVDKGNKQMRQKISYDFYKELLTIKGDSNRVFDISSDSLDNTFKRLKIKMGLQEERNLVFHSIRKSAISYRYRITGDILEAQRAANHSNINTTMIYLQHEDYGMIGAVSNSQNLDMELFKNVDNEVLIQAISQCKKDMQLILNIKINEILKNK
jgi:integrase